MINFYKDRVFQVGFIISFCERVVVSLVSKLGHEIISGGFAVQQNLVLLLSNSCLLSSKFLLEQTARKSDNKHLSKLREMASSQTNTSRDGVGALDPEKGDVTRPQLSALGHLQRTFSRVSTDDIGPPPDGGLPAWSQVVLCHISTINTWGLLHMMSGA